VCDVVTFHAIELRRYFEQMRQEAMRACAKHVEKEKDTRQRSGRKKLAR
jgi:hypothetical protein